MIRSKIKKNRTVELFDGDCQRLIVNRLAALLTSHQIKLTLNLECFSLDNSSKHRSSLNKGKLIPQTLERYPIQGDLMKFQISFLTALLGIATCQTALSTTSVVQHFDNVVAQKISTLFWECNPQTRVLSLVHTDLKRSESGVAVQSYTLDRTCLEDQEELNRTLPRIVDQDGTFHEQNLLVCVGNNFYLVKQNTLPQDIDRTGERYKRRFAVATGDCTRLAKKYQRRIGALNVFSLIFSKSRVADYLMKAEKEEAIFLEKYFQ